MYPVIDRGMYEGHGDGFGESSQAEVNELNKALSAGYANDAASQGNGGALRVESLDSTLKIVSFMQKHIVFYNDIPKSKAYNTVEEYNLLSKFGGRGGHFINEGGLPRTEDSKYQRKVQFVKFMGTTREITHPMLLVKPAHGNVVALETKNGAMWMLEHCERGLFDGDSSIISQEYDGFFKQLIDGYADSDFAGDRLADTSDEHIIDLRGKQAMSEKVFSQCSDVLIRNYTYGTVCYMNPANHEDFDTQFFSKGRYALTGGTNEVGFHTEKVKTAMGKVSIRPTVFMEIDGVAPAVADNDAAPTAPAGVANVAQLASGSDSFAADEADTYHYEVSAVSKNGESAATYVGSGLAVASGEEVKLTITRGAVSGNDLTTGYRIYRSRKGGGAASKRYFVRAIPSAGASTVVLDTNRDLPGLGKALLGQMDESVCTLRELSPMLKFPLATVASSIRWMQLYYNTPIIFRPRSWVIVKNIKRLPQV